MRSGGCAGTRDSVCTADPYVKGLVQVMHNKRWGTVCSLGFGMADANVACRSMGLGEAASWAETNQKWQSRRQPIWMASLACRGSESSLKECRFSGWQRNNCSHVQDVSVKCLSDDTDRFASVRLVDAGNNSRVLAGGSHVKGRLEVFKDGVWGTVCRQGFSDTSAKVACRAIGLQEGAIEPLEQRGEGYIRWSHLRCTGDEHSLDDCSSNEEPERCTHSQDVWISCKHDGSENTRADVRLVDASRNVWGSTKAGTNFMPRRVRGRLEVKHEGQWGTVCADRFDERDARVACAAMGHRDGFVMMPNKLAR